MGFDADREDQIVVQSMAFEAPMVAVEDIDTEPVWIGYAERFWRPAVLTLAAFGAAVYLRTQGGSGDGGQLSGGAGARYAAYGS